MMPSLNEQELIQNPPLNCCRVTNALPLKEKYQMYPTSMPGSILIVEDDKKCRI
jgi:hypothetical protein